LDISNTRWLALAPALERLIKCFTIYQRYFIYIKNENRFSDKNIEPLIAFFADPLSLPWAITVYNLACAFHNSVQLIEGNKTNIISGIATVDSLKHLLTRDRGNLNTIYIPDDARVVLANLADNEQLDFRR